MVARLGCNLDVQEGADVAVLANCKDGESAKQVLCLKDLGGTGARERSVRFSGTCGCIVSALFVRRKPKVEQEVNR